MNSDYTVATAVYHGRIPGHAMVLRYPWSGHGCLLLSVAAAANSHSLCAGIFDLSASVYSEQRHCFWIFGLL